MANTYELISSNILSSSSSSVTFSSIPATFNDLLLRVSVRNSTAGFQNYFLKVNSIASDYSTTILYGSGSALSSLRYSGESSGYRVLYGQPGSDSASNTFSNAEFYIPRYTDSIAKPNLIHSVTENTATEAYSSFSAGYLNNTAAITSLQITTASSFVTNSSFYLYGIKNS